MLGSVLKWLLRRSAAPRPQAHPEAPAPAHNSRTWQAEGLQLQHLKRFHEAAALSRSVLAGDPDNVEALQLLSAALLAQGNSKEGLACLRRAAQLAPESADLQANLASVLARTGDHAGAIDAYRNTLALRPASIDDWNALALLLKALGRYDQAEECCRGGLSLDARHPGLRHTLSGALFEQGRVDEAIAEIRVSLDAEPSVPAAHSDFVRMLNYVWPQDPVTVYQEHRRWDERHARSLGATVLPHRNVPDPDRRLRAGFVSPYFRKHAMTFFFESLVEHHDPDDLEIFLYADVQKPDDYSARLRDHGAVWRSTVGKSDAELADMVRDDAVDILVDLSGHTPHHRLLAFARRPAPVQVTWNGYPNTTGMAAVDYRITDARCDPPGATEHLHAEKLVRLAGIYMAWRPPLDAPEPGSPPALRSGQITFGSFNSCFKVTPVMVALWARILERVPRSRLMLLTINGATAERRLRELFRANGIGSERLEILPRMSHEEFLVAHQSADVALDTFPYHGTTTTCFSLWMGLPVVVLEGAVHASRVGSSMLHALDAGELIARSEDEYVEIAVRLAGDLTALAKMRSGLRAMMLRSPLTDGAGNTRNLAAAFRDMWKTWCRDRSRTAEHTVAVPQPRNVVVQSHYGPIIINRYDTMIGRCISEQGWWEKDEIELLRWFLTAGYGAEPAVEILDIGAYNGVYTIALARFPFPEVIVHAFEPQREVFEMLTGSVALNGLTNVCCHHKAVSSESGKTLRFPAVDYDRPANFGSVEIEPVARADFDGKRLEGAAESVETVTIDDLGLNRVRLMKIDAEGMEHKVLVGAADTIRRCRPLIFLEYEKTDFDALKSFLRDAGYRSYYSQRPNILCVPGELDRIKIEGAVSVRY